MKNLLKSIQRVIILSIVFITFQSQVFAQSKPICEFLGISRKSFVTTCLAEKWKFTTNEKGSMNFDYAGGNWYVSFDENDVIDLINLTSFGKENGESMMQNLTSDAYLINDDATVTIWRKGNNYLMYLKAFQPGNGSSILITNELIGTGNLTSSL